MCFHLLYVRFESNVKWCDQESRRDKSVRRIFTPCINPTINIIDCHSSPISVQSRPDSESHFTAEWSNMCCHPTTHLTTTPYSLAHMYLSFCLTCFCIGLNLSIFVQWWKRTTASPDTHIQTYVWNPALPHLIDECPKTKRQ